MLATPIAPRLSTTSPAPYPGTIFAAQGADYGLTFQLKAGQTAGNTIVAKANANQTGSLQQWQDSFGTVLGNLSAIGGLSVTPNTGPLGSGATVTGVPGLSALSVLSTPQVVASNAVGGTDYSFGGLAQVAVKFNSGSFTNLQGVYFSLKVDSVSIPSAATFRVSLSADSGGVPGATVTAGGSSIFAGSLNAATATDSYGLLALTTLTPNTDYWLVLTQASNGAFNFVLNTRTDVGAMATFSDGVWSLVGTPQTPVFTLYAGGVQGIGAASTNNLGAFFSSQTSTAIRGQSTAGNGISAVSINNAGIAAVSTYGTGMSGTTTLGSAMSGVVSGTVAAGNLNNTAFNLTRTPVLSSATSNVIGDFIFGNDAPSGGVINTSNLIRLQSGGVSRFQMAQSGLLVTNFFTSAFIGTGLTQTAGGLTNSAQSNVGGNLVNGAVYRYVATNVNATGVESSYSTVELVVTVPAGGTGTSGQQSVGYSSVSGAVSYNFYRSDPNGATGVYTTLAGSVPAGTSPFVDTGTGSVKAPPTPVAGLMPINRIAGNSVSNSFFSWASSFNISANSALLTLTGAPLDGVSTGKFAGSGSGTYFGINMHALGASDFARYQVFGSDRYRLTSAGFETLTVLDALTASQAVSRTDIHTTSGTPTANFGTKYLFQLHSSNNTVRDAVGLVSYWTTATDGATNSAFQIQTVTPGIALVGQYTFNGGGPFTIANTLPGNKALTVLGNGSGTVNIAEFGPATARTLINSHGDLFMSNATTGSIGGEYATPVASLGASSGSGGSLTNGSVYFWKVVFVDTYGLESVPSNELTATIPAGGPGTGSQVINWTLVTGVSQVRIYRTAADAGSGTENVLAGTVAGNLATFTDTAAGSAQSPSNATGIASVRQPSFMGFYNHNALGALLHVSEHQTGTTTRPMAAFGSGPFDGASTGFYNGAGSGTVLGINTLTARDFANYQALGVLRYKLAASGIETLALSDAITNTAPAGRINQHLSSGTPAASFGWSEKVQLHSSNNTLRDASALATTWTTATDGSQASQFAFQLVNAGGALTTAATLIPAGWSIPTAVVSDAATNTQATALNIYHKTSGSAATNLGVATTFLADSDTTPLRQQGQIQTLWATVTDASRKARMVLVANDAAGAREGLRIEASGTAAMIGFLGAAAVVRQTLAAAATDLPTVITLANSLRTALINLGLGV